MNNSGYNKEEAIFISRLRLIYLSLFTFIVVIFLGFYIFGSIIGITLIILSLYILKLSYFQYILSIIFLITLIYIN
jgi:hypothetical protein